MISVRTATAGDASAIVEFQIAMATETEGLNLVRETVQKGVQAVFTDPKKGTYWVAVEDGQVVASTLTIPEWSDWRNGTATWIHSVYVMPQARHRGVFRAIYQHLKTRVANDPTATCLRLYVDKRNITAQKIYQNLGMTAEHYDMFEWQKP